ncbi:alpha/beta hydrolase [Streptomyces sp. URMC 123]|uniref:alpha/beta hydrolase n=1 Tax=Streptomyces sp. URMC 123 TaxID=3423403 RepID=UPI003F1D5F6C
MGADCGNGATAYDEWQGTEGFEEYTAVTTVVETTVGGRPALRIRPLGPTRGTVLHLHGGGYRTGSPEGGRGVGAYLAVNAGVETVLPAYRLAEEAPFPAAVDDGLACYAELLGEPGADPGRLVLMGESAGGGLALATLLTAREAGLPRPAAAVCLSPWFDLTASGDSYERCGTADHLISRTVLKGMADLYLAGADPRTPTASPLFAPDDALAWLPPLLVQASRDEVLADDAVRLAERVTRVGGQCVLRTFSDATHCWHHELPALPRAETALNEVVEFLLERLGQGASSTGGRSTGGRSGPGARA